MRAPPVVRIVRALALLVLLLVVPLAAAQNESNSTASAPPSGISYVLGGEPGIQAFIDGTDLAHAAHPRDAFTVDPDRPINLTLTLSPPPNVTWEIRSIHVAVVVNGPGSEPPSSLSRDQSFNASLPPGFTVFVNRTIGLAQLKHVGTGLFLMRVDVQDKNGTRLYDQEFYVLVEGNVILTASGAVVTAASVATGYGLWQIVRDVREAYKARQRHKKEKERQDATAMKAAATKATGMLTNVIGLTAGLEGVVDVAGDVDKETDELSKRGPLAWTATGLGLGGVTMSWLQFLGYLPLNLGQTAIMAAGAAGTFLTGALLLTTVTKRIKRRREASRRVPVKGPAAEEEADAAVEPPLSLEEP